MILITTGLRGAVAISIERTGATANRLQMFFPVLFFGQKYGHELSYQALRWIPDMNADTPPAPNRIREDIVWGMRLFFMPLDTGNSIVAMIAKQCMAIAFCSCAFFMYW